MGGYYHVIHFDVHGALIPYETYQQLQQQYVGDRILLETPYGHQPLAASILTELILERYGATRYRQDPALRQLLKPLDGFPLALEVVLSNLAHQTPQEVLAALQAGDVSLDKGNAQQKTESILRCIAYAHSNLSQDIQQLLLCLAPFTSVLYQPLLDAYTQFLRQQPLLATLPFERWAEVVDAAKHWGLSSPDADLSDYLHLQPTLPYSLRNRLHAINTAFHEVYDQFSAQLDSLQQSKEPRERQIGKILTELEYENLTTALNLALELQISCARPYNALTSYLGGRQDHHRALALYQSTTEHMEAFPPEQLAGPLGFELASIIKDLGTKNLQLKRFTDAIAAYQRALQVLLQVTRVKQQLLDNLKAKLYHGLGRVAQEQREFQQARDFFLNALEIVVATEDNYNRSIVLSSIARLWQASGDETLPTIIAPLLISTSPEAEGLLRSMLEKKPDEPNSEHLTEG